jgi:hypothetical protein
VHRQPAVGQPTSNDPRHRVRFPDPPRSQEYTRGGQLADECGPRRASDERGRRSALHEEPSDLREQPVPGAFVLSLSASQPEKSNGEKTVCVLAGTRKALTGISAGQSLDSGVPPAGFEPAHTAPERSSLPSFRRSESYLTLRQALPVTNTPLAPSSNLRRCQVAQCRSVTRYSYPSRCAGSPWLRPALGSVKECDGAHMLSGCAG